MKITIDVRWPRWLQARRRRTKVVIAGLVAAGIVAVPVAWASHDFTDVPTGHPFHSQISAVKSAGITAGKTCVPPGTPPTYCPTEAITREAMAAFVQRGMTRGAMDTIVNSDDIQTVAFENVITETMTVPGAAGTQYVKVDAWVQVDSGTDSLIECELAGRVVQDVGDPGEVASPEQVITVEPSANMDETIRASFVFEATSGSHDYTLQATNWNGCGTTPIVLATSAIMLTTFPFNQFGDGSTGLSPGEPQTSFTGPVGD